MKLISKFLSQKKKQSKTVAYYKQELLVKTGREQFKKLLDRGLGLPIVLR